MIISLFVREGRSFSVAYVFPGLAVTHHYQQVIWNLWSRRRLLLHSQERGIIHSCENKSPGVLTLLRYCKTPACHKKITRPLTRHDPIHADQGRRFKTKSWAESGRVGSGRVGSGQETSKSHGSGRITPGRSGPTREKSRKISGGVKRKKCDICLLALLCLFKRIDPFRISEAKKTSSPRIVLRKHENATAALPCQLPSRAGEQAVPVET